MRRVYKTVRVELDEYDLEDLYSDRVAELMQELKELKEIVQDLKKHVRFVPYSHEAILFERLMRATNAS
jgi:hypothetical protein